VDKTSSLELLLGLSSEPIAPSVATSDELWLRQYGEAGNDLCALIRRANGFYCFGSALHVRSSESREGYFGLREWNATKGWRAHYPSLREGSICFAEDLFGGQFVLSGDGVSRFNPETGAIKHHSSDLDEWASRLLERYNSETGWEAGRDWQLRNHSLPMGSRLIPKMPFVLGGSYVAENLQSSGDWQAMLLYANLSRQIRDVPDGMPVRVSGWPS
jgi:hypothetical protein